MKPLRVHSLAEAEFEEAIDFYNDRRTGLGKEFKEVVKQALKRIRRNPKIGSPYRSGYRMLYVGGPFPYSIFYWVYDTNVWVASIYHSSREPDAWMDRTPE